MTPANWAEIEFLPTVRRILHGEGIAVARLGSELERLGAGRALLLTPRSLAGQPQTRTLEAALGGAHAATVVAAFEHVPAAAVLAVAEAARDCDADALVALGGGSVIDAGKAARFCLAEDISTVHGYWSAVGRGARAAGAWLPQISVPTTLSGAEYSRSFSTTDLARATKLSVTDSRVACATVVYDPHATLATPTRLWLASGVAALDHAVEVFCAQPPHPVGDLLKAEAARTLWLNLPRTRDDPADLDARLRCQLAAWQVDHSPLRVRADAPGRPLVSHALAYDFAAELGLDYGVIACMTLAPALRWAARHEPGSLRRQAELARRLDLADSAAGPAAAAGALHQQLERFCRGLGLPASVAEAGIEEDALRRVAAAFVGRRPFGAGVDPASEAEVVELLRGQAGPPTAPEPDLGRAFALGAGSRAAAGLPAARWDPRPESEGLVAVWCARVGCEAVWTQSDDRGRAVTVFDFRDGVEVVVDEQVAWNLADLLVHVEDAHREEAARRTGAGRRAARGPGG